MGLLLLEGSSCFAWSLLSFFPPLPPFPFLLLLPFYSFPLLPCLVSYHSSSFPHLMASIPLLSFPYSPSTPHLPPQVQHFCLLVISPSTYGIGLGDGFPALQGDGQSSSIEYGSLRSGLFKKQSLLQKGTEHPRPDAAVLVC